MTDIENIDLADGTNDFIKEKRSTITSIYKASEKKKKTLVLIFVDRKSVV